MKYFLLLTALIGSHAHATGYLQNSDFATRAAITGAGGNAQTQLLQTGNISNDVDVEALDTSIARWNAKLSSPVNLATQVTGLLPNANLANPATTVNGQTCTLGSTCTVHDASAVTSLSFTTSNGFAGSSSGGTTPVITLSTTVTGVVKGNGTALSVAAASDIVGLFSTCSGTQYLGADGACHTAAAGTVTSVGFTDASTTPIYTITNTPITTSGTLTETLKTETANTLFAGPTTGSAAQPTFRALVASDLPAPTTSALGASNIDWSILKNIDGLYTLTLSANTTLTWSNVAAGQTMIIAITNTASNYTVTWPAAAKWSGGTAPTETVGAHTDVITCKSYDGTNAYCSSVQNF